MFQDGQEFAKYEQFELALTDAQLSKVKQAFQTIALISEEVNSTIRTVQTIITEDLVRRKMYAKLEPKLLSEEQ